MNKTSSPGSDECSASTDDTVVRRSASKEANEGVIKTALNRRILLF